MYKGAVARTNLRHRNPAILLEVSRNDDVLIRHIARRRKSFRFGHGKHNVGRRDIPAGSYFYGRRSGCGIAFGSVRVGPGGESGDFLRSQRTIVREMTTAWVGEPGGHFAQSGLFTNRRSERARVRIRIERHGGDFAGPMAALTVRLKDGQYVMEERRRAGHQDRR